jgi:hypothetical protein
MRRLSIRTLMVFVLVSAICLAAVTNASEPWAVMMILIVLVVVVAATAVAVCTQGNRRAWCMGFAFLGGAYLITSNSPGGSQSNTTRALRYVIAQASRSPVIVAEVPAQHFRTTSGELDRAALESFVRHIGPGSPSYHPASDHILVIRQPGFWWRTLLPGTANRDAFIRVGHAFFALLAGLLGGTAGYLLRRLVTIGHVAAEVAIRKIGKWLSRKHDRVRRAF